VTFPGAGASVYYNEDGEPLGWDYAPDGPADPYDDDGDYGDCDDCPWCASEDRDDEDDVEYLCRSHLAEYEGLSENELDRRDAEEAADQL
jgi:hypothetical protein